MAVGYSRAWVFSCWFGWFGWVHPRLSLIWSSSGPRRLVTGLWMEKKGKVTFRPFERGLLFRWSRLVPWISGCWWWCFRWLSRSELSGSGVEVGSCTWGWELGSRKGCESSRGWNLSCWWVWQWTCNFYCSRLWTRGCRSKCSTCLSFFFNRLDKFKAQRLDCQSKLSDLPTVWETTCQIRQFRKFKKRDKLFQIS